MMRGTVEALDGAANSKTTEDLRVGGRFGV